MNWIARHRLLVFAAIALLVAVFILAGHFNTAIPFLSAPWRGEQSFEDVLRKEGRKTPIRNDLVFLGIDQSSLELPPLSPEEIASNHAFQLMTERPFPWSREVWALLLDRLFGAGAKLVMFDIVFNPPNPGDAAFHDALERYKDRVVLGENFDMQNSAQLIVPNATLIPSPEQDDRVGYVNYFPDPVDNTMRAATFELTDRQLAGLPPGQGEIIYRSFVARGLEKIWHGGDAIRDRRNHLFRFSDPDAYPPLPLYEVFDPKMWKANYKDGAFFKDKIVIVGASAQILQDFKPTPLNPAMPGPAIHINVMAAALQHEFLKQTSENTMYGLVLGAAAAAFLLSAFVRRPLICIATLLVVSLIYLAVARIAYDKIGLFIITVPVLSAFLLAGLLTIGIDYALERMEKVRTRRTLERYVSKNLVKEILENPGGFYSTMRGARKPVTVLFSDLVGFTTLSEKADPEELVRHLNEYLSKMVGVVFENGGTLDKFIGDAIMAVWGNVKSLGVVEDTKACARTALGMREQLLKLNEGWEAQGRMKLGMGIGINQGEALVGNIGSYEPHERLDPTVIGDAVNLASRLEGLTRVYGVDILVGATAAEMIRDEFHLRTVARAQVKGKTEPVEIFTIIDRRHDGADQELLQWMALYEEAMVKFRHRDFTAAKTLLARFREHYPRDYLAEMYLNRAIAYEKEPPDEKWDAVEVFTKK
ncbi:MAG: adenylate/guanylate cyclase domain-containing protein [Verrucomicrobiota bacterium]|nr:adenylate/guanylate cyclase domain-containing protein [Verrucomicrobiota bacterium]